jgi:hypothetical protein
MRAPRDPGDMVSARAPVVATVLLLVLHFAAALYVWSDLPRRVPVHLDLQGEPTRWAATTLLSWMAPWFFAVGTVLVVLGAAVLGRASPSLWNIPNRASFFALPPYLRGPVEARIRRLLAWVAFFGALCFAGVHLGMFRTAHGEPVGPAFWALTFLPMVAILLVAARESRTIGAEIRRMAARAATER